MLFPDAAVAERFSRKVELIPFSDCHYWNGCVEKRGYGRFGIGSKVYLAHRVSYALANGDCPKHLEIRHRCDNPSCVNPAHLEPGTHRENMADMQARRRQRLGERHPCAKLTDAQMADLICAIEAGEQTGIIADRFGVSRAHVSCIRHGNVGPNHPARRLQKPTGRTDRRVSDDTAREIYRRIHSGESGNKLAAEYGVKPSFVSDIKRGATYASVTGHRS
jgi:hypothetical protein